MAENDQSATPAASGATPSTDAAVSPAGPAAAPDKSEMTAIEAPPLAPAAAPEVEVGAPTASPSPAASRFAWPSVSSLSVPTLSRRMRRRAALAATVALAAGIGGVLGAFAVGAHRPVTQAHDTAAVLEREAMQKTIARLGKEVATLRAGLDSAGKSTAAQIAKLHDKNEKLSEKLAAETRRAAAAAASSDITGSITPAVPLPMAKPSPSAPAVKAAAVPETKPPVIEGWAVRSVRNGVVLVEGRGEIYEVIPGAPLPGLGRVEAIERRDGRWVVVTQKGLIVAMQPPPRPLYGRY